MVGLSDFDEDIAEGAAREALRGLGVWRRPAFLAPAVAARLDETAGAAAGWRRSIGAHHALETARLPPDAAAAFKAALARLGLKVRGAPAFVRHGPGGYDAPAAEGGVGCLLDLAAGWPSQHGGLLLIIEPEGSVHGWRPEAGALTLYAAERAPLLSMVAPGAPRPRHALFARAAAV